MRLRLKVRLKALCCVLFICTLCLLGYYNVNLAEVISNDQTVSVNGRKVASINSEEMEAFKKQVGESQESFPAYNGAPQNVDPVSSEAPKNPFVLEPCDDGSCLSGKVYFPLPTPHSIKSKDKFSEEKLDKLESYRDNQLFLIDKFLTDNEHVDSINSLPFSSNNNSNDKINTFKDDAVLRGSGGQHSNLHPTKDWSSAKLNCKNGGKGCKSYKIPKFNKSKTKGYVSRVMVENISLPSDWSASPDLSRKFKERKERAKEVCHKYGLDQRSSNSRPNSWEFLINEKYGLVWCSVFKAASSTWFYNFNILAGYTESQLMTTKETPIALARKRYPRPTAAELDRVTSTNSTLSFMIARHPFERLVSAFRDKFQSGNRFYRSLARKIMTSYPSLGPVKQMTFSVDVPTILTKSKYFKQKTTLKYVPPSFSQFVQFIIDSSEKNKPMDEHWTPMTSFCTPCLVDFDVYAKVESLDEDGNYIIFKSGIEKLIHPKRINRSKNEPTNEVARSFLCQLSPDQIKRLLNVYKYDLEIFDYKTDHLLNCS